MAGLAFTAYGIHWFAMAHRRYIDASAAPDGWMAIAFLFISILGSTFSGVRVRNCCSASISWLREPASNAFIPRGANRKCAILWLARSSLCWDRGPFRKQCHSG